MALVEMTDAVDKVEIVGAHKHVQVRSATWVEKDGQIIGGKQYHRRVIAPGDDVSSEPELVQNLCAIVHTQEVIDAYAAHQASQGA